jgi:hypothetical protein
VIPERVGGIPVNGESRSVFAQLWEEGVGLVTPGRSSAGRNWTEQTFAAKARKLSVVSTRTDNTTDRLPDRNTWKGWREGKPVSRYYQTMLRAVFLGQSPACERGPSAACGRCEPCGWKAKLDAWFSSPVTGSIRTPPKASGGVDDHMGAATHPSASHVFEPSDAPRSSDLFAGRDPFVEFVVEKSDGACPAIVASLSYGAEKFQLPATDDLPALRGTMRPLELVIRVGVAPQWKDMTSVLNTERVGYSRGEWKVDASERQNDRFPLQKTQLVALHPGFPDDEIPVSVGCDRDDLKPDIIDPPSGVTAADLRVLERVLQVWDLTGTGGEVPLSTTILRRKRHAS